MLNVCWMYVEWGASNCWANLGMAMPDDFSEAEIPADSIRNVTLEQARGQEIGFTLWFKTVETRWNHLKSIKYYLRIWNTINEQQHHTAPRSEKRSLFHQGTPHPPSSQVHDVAARGHTLKVASCPTPRRQDGLICLSTFGKMTITKMKWWNIILQLF